MIHTINVMDSLGGIAKFNQKYPATYNENTPTIYWGS